MNDKPSQTTPYPLRMPDKLKAKVKAASKKSGRSMNAEICHWLEYSLSKRRLDPADGDERAAFMESLRKLVDDYDKGQEGEDSYLYGSIVRDDRDT